MLRRNFVPVGRFLKLTDHVNLPMLDIRRINIPRAEICDILLLSSKRLIDCSMARTINLGHPVRNIAHKSIEFQCCPSSLRVSRTDCNKVVPFGPVGEPLYEGG